MTPTDALIEKMARAIKRLWPKHHRHEWEHYSTETIGGQTYDDGRVAYRVGKRTVHFRRCRQCSMVFQYYPDDPLLSAGLMLAQGHGFGPFPEAYSAEHEEDGK